MPKTLYRVNAEVGKTASQERISERRQVIEVPKTLYRDGAEVENIPQKCISQRSQVIDVPKNLIPGKCRGRPGLVACSEALHHDYLREFVSEYWSK